MEITYILKIDCELQQFEEITDILGNEPSKEYSGYWELILVERDSEPPVDFIDIFLDLLKNKYDQLLSLGIQRKDIDIWMLYEYENQCNIEIPPVKTKRLGENQISLCISCWESSNVSE